jgi:uncharacterized protein DUF6265
MQPPIRIIVVTASIWLATCAHAAEKISEHTWKMTPGEKSPPATLADMRWLAGHWVGEAFGGKTEELWSAPAGPNMAGMYRLVKGDKTIFYELMTVVEDAGSLVFRLKHFNADLTGWEEKNEVRSFPLVAKRDGALHFEGMSFHPDGDELTVYLAIEHKDKPIEEVTFTYRRVRTAP